MKHRLDAARAESLAHIIAGSLRREYPTQIAHLLRGADDLRAPRELTPMFYGCFDWHSAVHCHWALLRMLRAFPDAAWAAHVRAALADSFTAERVGGELAYLVDRPGFELPYGNAWLLQLDAELAEAALGDPEVAGWRAHLAPLGAAAGRRMLAWLQRLGHPIRAGEHSQSAFAMGLALDWARASGSAKLADCICEQARRFYQDDRDAPLAYEPSAFDFLSPALGEADLMRRVLGPGELVLWLAAFLPRGVDLRPVTPVDRSDGKLVHFDGLNLSRAWMMRGVALSLPERHAQRAELLAAAADHERAAMDGLGGRHYAGSHWLGSFAVYLLTDRGLGGAAR
ncbi:MAG TPA: DUF2891 domain-containing protein [Kofleriaceae bacterium]|nr:DUF2891 domain-containing protein [Kofleriaceae bacterium]